MQDCVTDAMVIGEEMTEAQGGPFLIHRGILNSARTLMRTLVSKNILKDSFEHWSSDYELIVTGHSLGGGVALALGLLLKQHHTNLNVFAFAPPLGTLCDRAADYMKEWALVVVNEKCMFSRMSYYTMLDLKKRMIKALETCKTPKYRLLEKTYCSLLGCMRAEHVESGSEDYTYRLTDSKSLVNFLRKDFYNKITSAQKNKVMPTMSGRRVLLLVRRVAGNGSGLAVLVGAEQLQTLLVHKTMLTDHFLKSINMSLDKLCEFNDPDSVRKLKEQ
ncbi:hypothetical protein Ciccas_004955 [Cichlidogyrus casuarinus]|uniref:sn-1-specific diacylglycerol lipase n=1 Tax=Cichlidogyrus casuarinus TaxID=1844966 RepID=A0ABD2QDJ7_9PLAT